MLIRHKLLANTAVTAGALIALVLVALFGTNVIHQGSEQLIAMDRLNRNLAQTLRTSAAFSEFKDAAAGAAFAEQHRRPASMPPAPTRSRVKPLTSATALAATGYEASDGGPCARHWRFRDTFPIFRLIHGNSACTASAFAP